MRLSDSPSSRTPMYRPILAPCAILCFSLLSFAQTPSQSLTILLQFDHPGSVSSQDAMQREVRGLLKNNFSVVRFGSLADPLAASYSRVVVFNVRGSCSMTEPLARQTRGLALGSTVVSEGTILPFGKVECDRVRASIEDVSRLT